ncbi:MAG: hypothetical protein GX591_15500 [Planctomycetes bacterium]|nr:hypothetical protein [Planctomycetota bacterium]
MTAETLIPTLAVTLVFVCIFLLGHRLRIHRRRRRRAGLSLAAGVAVAYVFVELLPELNEATERFVDATADRSLPMAEYHVHLAALIGFAVFYGLEHLVTRTRRATTAHTAFRVQIAGFAAYAALVGYLLIRGTALDRMWVPLYALAMGLHFLGVDHAMERENEQRYLRSGRYVLAAAAVLGWVCGAWVEIPVPVVTLLAGGVSGGVIINSMVMELPAEKDGRFWPFVIGAIAYAAIILLATAAGNG